MAPKLRCHWYRGDSFCTDMNANKISELTNRLGTDFEVKYNKDCELITVRHFDEQTIDKLVENRVILLEQRTRTSAQLVVKN